MSGLRGAARRVRSAVAGSPAPGQAAPAADPVERILDAGALDLDWYRSQADVPLDTAADAARHYLDSGAAAGLSPHPAFVVPEPARGTPALAAYLRAKTPKGRRLRHPVWDVAAYERDHTDARTHPRGTLGHLLERLPDDPSVRVHGQGPDAAPVPWSRVDALLRRAVASWHDDRRRVGTTRSSAKAPDGWDGPLPAPSDEVVSVVVVSRDRAALLRRSVESVRAQTHAALEVVVVDDGSRDDTPLVLEAVARHEPRLRVLRLDGVGPAAARRAALASATGRHVLLLDDAATLRPDALARLLGGLVDDVDAIHAAARVSGPGPARFVGGPVDRDDLLLGATIDLSSVLVRREVLDRVVDPGEGLDGGPDDDLVLRLAEQASLRWVPAVAVDREQAADDGASWNDAARVRHRAVERPELRAGVVSVVVPTRDAPARLRASLDHLDGLTPDPDVVVVDLGSARDAWLEACALELARPGTTVLRDGRRSSWAVGARLGLASATGSTVLLLDPDVDLGADAARALLDAVGPDAALAQPVVVDADDTVRDVGAVLVDAVGLPTPLLSGHARGELDQLPPGPVEIATATGRVLAADTRRLLDVGGPDPALAHELVAEDLGLRLRAAGGRVVLVPGAVATTPGVTGAGPTATWDDTSPASRELFATRHRGTRASGLDWADLGYVVLSWRGADGRGAWSGRQRPVPLLARARTTVDAGPFAGRRSLRWSLHVPPGVDAVRTDRRRGLAHDVAAALRVLGQEVVVSGAPVARPSSGLDDLTLLVAGDQAPGQDPFVPALLWLADAGMDVDTLDPSPRTVLVGSPVWQPRLAARGVEARLLPWPHTGDVPAVEGDPVDVLVDEAADDRLELLVRRMRSEGLVVATRGSGWDDETTAPVTARWTLVGGDHLDRLEGFVPPGVRSVLASGGHPVVGDVAGLDPALASAVRTFATPGELLDVVRTTPPPVDDEVVRLAHGHAVDAAAGQLAAWGYELVEAGTG